MQYRGQIGLTKYPCWQIVSRSLPWLRWITKHKTTVVAKKKRRKLNYNCWIYTSQILGRRKWNWDLCNWLYAMVVFKPRRQRYPPCNLATSTNRNPSCRMERRGGEVARGRAQSPDGGTGCKRTRDANPGHKVGLPVVSLCRHRLRKLEICPHHSPTCIKFIGFAESLLHRNIIFHFNSRNFDIWRRTHVPRTF